MEYGKKHTDGSRSGGQKPEPKLLTEAEWVARLVGLLASDTCDALIAELRERGLIAEPVDPLVYEARRLVIQDGTTRTANQIEAIRDGRAGKEKVSLALAALKRGMELRPELTREMMREAVQTSLGEGESVQLWRSLGRWIDAYP